MDNNEILELAKELERLYKIDKEMLKKYTKILYDEQD